MKNKLKELTNELNSMYVTTNPVNLTEEDMGYKHFLCFNNTHKVVDRAKTQNEMVEILEDVIEHGVQLGSLIFH